MTYQEELHAFLRAQIALREALDAIHGAGEVQLIDDEL